ncbi:hypothetical protein [Actinomyces stomatis]|uniref:hypothetical protein n=1 Tax=Actinomyces stomatis TaxID=3050227 RepID=UPI0028524912|nr:hypothetical protein [Actinomyces sp. PK606]
MGLRSDPGAFGVVNPLVWGWPAGSLRFPPEVWQRVLWAWQRWLSRHEGLARGLFRLSRISQRITIVLLVVAVLVVPRLAVALKPVVWMLACLGVVVLLSRTRTVSWRAVSVMFSVSVPWALVVAEATVLVAASGGMTTSDDGTGIALAAFVEEPGKLVPLVVVALVAPGRVRRLAAVDWALLGYAAGAGFTVAEDGARRLMPQGVLASLPNDGGLEYSLNAWTAGSFRMWDSDSLVGRLNDDLGPSPLAVGHHVSTMTVAMAIGLGIVLWRTRNPVGRVAAWVVPVAAFVQVVVDHAAYNASVAALGSVSWLDSDDAVLSWLGAAWQLSGRGGDEIAYSLVLFGLCLLADARRRLRTGVLGVTAGEAPRASLLTVIGGPAFVRAPIEAVVALVVLSYSDLAVIARGYTDRRMTRPQRMIEGRLTAAQVMETRRDAMAATTPGVEPAARWAFAVLALTVSAVAALLCLWCGVVIAQAIGSSLLFGDSDSAFFAGLLDKLATWWDLLGPTGQLLVTALGVMLLMSAGSTFALAMGAVGVLTWAAAHGHGLASFIHNPGAATSSYLSNVTAGQLAWDLFDFALTFIPGSVFGAGAHTIARTTARDMAASRTALRQGGKKATQATEQAAARTEAQRVAESQAAHTKATEAARKVHQQRRYRTKTVSSEHPAESEHALSGWSEERRPSGFQKPNVSEVLRVTDEMGYPRTPHPYDQGTPGLYHASHAERQKALIAKWPHLGVSKPICEDCNGWFRSLAQHQGRDWYVTDPNGVWRFRSDGTITAPDGRIFNPNEAVPSTYF